jgi:hypothetical protein
MRSGTPSRSNPGPPLTTKAVLFQNGTWGRWREALDFAASEGHTVPAGEMSDSRAAAFLCSIYGHNFLEKCGGSRWVFYGAKATSVFGSWNKLKGIMYSNTYWLPAPRYEPRETCGGEDPEELDTIPGVPEKRESEFELWYLRSASGYWDIVSRTRKKRRTS